MYFISDFWNILFADDTTLYNADSSLDCLISRFKLEFEKVSGWISYNRLYINWSKTKFMIISKNNIGYFTENITLAGNLVEVVFDFKLLGCTLDNKLTFVKHVDILTTNINAKLFAIKNIFYLSADINFKTFIQPHFDYCFSLFIYMCNTLINKLTKLFNSCLWHLLKINLHDVEQNKQLDILKPYFLLPFKYRLFFRFCLFSYKILNKQILNNILNSLKLNENPCNLREFGRDIYCVPFSGTNKGNKRISIYLTKLVNKILRNSFNLNLIDFENFLLLNIDSLFLKFEKFILI